MYFYRRKAQDLSSVDTRESGNSEKDWNEAKALLVRWYADHAPYPWRLNDEMTALHYTAWAGELDAMRVLIQMGEDVNAVDKDKRTALTLQRADRLTLRECCSRTVPT